MEGKGENGLVDGSSDCEDERAKLRPADIDADVREMERRKRVEAMMSSRLFREELERIVEAQMKDGAAAVGPLLQQIQDMIQTGPARANTFSLKSTNCVIPINDIRGVESMGYAKGEKMLRCKLAAVYRLMDLYGWTQGIQNHVTGRLNQEEELLLVNAYGMLYHEVTASSLVKVDMQGNIVEPGTTNYGVNVQGFHLHAAIHQARPDIKCIIHVHTPSVLAVSSLKAGLLPLSNESVVIGEVSSHQSTGSIQEPEEKDKLARNLGPINKVMLLSNHGAVCCGETVEEAFFNLYNTVLACESQMKVMPLGIDNLVLMTDEARKAIYDASHRVPESTALPSTTGQPSENKEKRWRIGGLHFEALMRMLDNAGFRTGYIYRTPLIKGEPPKPRSDVEVPPAVSSLGYLLEEEEMYRNWKKMGGTKNDRTRWLNSPNVYQKVEILETGTPDPKKITKWVADGSPTHSSTPVKISDALQFVPKNTNPKEFKKLQQQIKENRRADKITSGPQSHILEGVTWEEAKKLQDANLSSAGDQVVLVGAASKGIIQREYQHNATVYKTPYAKNPFDSVSAQEIEEYKRTVTRKQRGESYDEEASESEALSSSAALPPSGLKSPPSETDDDSRTEPRVLRIETKTAPIPSQAEYVLSDDEVTGPSKLDIHKIRCFTRVWHSPSPACKERPVVVDLSLLDRKLKLDKGLLSIQNKQCQFCKSFTGRKESHVNPSDLSNKSTQTILNIVEVKENCLCSSKEVGGTCVKRLPVARKLDMDSVIEELKGKLKLNYCNRSSKENDRSAGSPEDEITMCTIHPIPQIHISPRINDTRDSTSEENSTTTSLSTDKENHSKIIDAPASKGIHCYIGDNYQGSESMCEKTPSPLKPPENLDSFALSDILSNIHVADEDESMSNNDLYITHHTNITKVAVLVENKFNPFWLNVSVECDELEQVDTAEKNFENDASLLEETIKSFEKDNSDHKFQEDIELIEKSVKVRSKQINDEMTDTSKSDTSNDINNNSELSTLINSTVSTPIECDKFDEKSQQNDNQEVKTPIVNFVCEISPLHPFPDAKFSSLLSCNSVGGNSLNLMIGGKELYHFYNEFDPDEVFQADPDNISMEVHYDSQSLLELKVDETVQSSIICEAPSETATCDLNSIVNENLFIGKKYLMKRYLCGKRSANEDIELTDSAVNYDGDKSCSLSSLTDKNYKSACAVSEDSAIYSELTLKNPNLYKQPVDSAKFFEWSLSENSKGEFSADSSGSSGIRVSTSDDDVPNRQTISSVDEFLIKETICKMCPDINLNFPCNSRLSDPVSPYFISPNNLKKTRSLPNIYLGEVDGLLNNVKLILHHNYYKMPDASKIRSYYTLVSGLDKSPSLPDIPKSSDNLTSEDFISKPNFASDIKTKDFLNFDVEDDGSYIFDDYIYARSEDGSIDSSRTSCMINDLFSMSDSETPKQPVKEMPHEMYPDLIDSVDMLYGVEESETKTNGVTVSANENQHHCPSPGRKHESSDFSTPEVKNSLESYILTQNSSSFKGCFKCYTSSMEDNITSMMLDAKKRNHIIGSLKKKFSKHKCNSLSFNRPRNHKPDKRMKSKCQCDFTVETHIISNKRCLLKPDILYNCKVEIQTPDSNVSFKSNQSSLYLSCLSLDNLINSGSSDHLKFQSSSNFSSSEEIFDTIVDSDTRRLYHNEGHVDHDDGDWSCVSSQGFIAPSFESETFFSIESENSFCSLDTETVLHCRSSESYTKGDDVLSRFESDSIKTNVDHNTAFVVEDFIREGSESPDSTYNPENSLSDLTVNVSSVSCQTDESFHDEYEYRAEDYMDVSCSPTNTLPESQQHVSDTCFNHSLYTIHETSETSPEY